MTDAAKVTLYHSPRTRSQGVRILLEELGAPYELHVLNFKLEEQHKPDYLAINPLGKVPAIEHAGAVVTEQVAIYIYLADAFPAAGLAPAIGDPLRGPYLRWIALYGSAFEPALIDRARKVEPGTRGMSPYGEYDAVIALVRSQLAEGALSVRRAPHRRGYFVGHGAALDDELRPRAADRGNLRLYRTDRGAAVGQEGREAGPRTRGGAGSRGAKLKGAKARARFAKVDGLSR